MSWLPDIRHRILTALKHGHLDHFSIAADLGEPPFRVRAELRELRRDRLVRDHIGPAGHRWELTDRGAAIAHHEDQTQLEVGR
jgi:predicted transcriptional regulator